MANLNDILDVVLRNEGGYNCAFGGANGSGETYRGIDRKYSQQWAGWPIIDQAKRLGRIDASCRKYEQDYYTPTLNALVKQWYTSKLQSQADYSKIQNQTLATFYADFWWHKPARALAIANMIAKRIEAERPWDFYELQLQVQPDKTKLSNSVIEVMNLYPDLFYKYLRQYRIQYYNNPQSFNSGWTEKFTTTLRGLLIRTYSFPAFIIDFGSLTNLIGF
jgi:hypothetical protein